jgi:hypothetical protein
MKNSLPLLVTVAFSVVGVVGGITCSSSPASRKPR